MNDIADRPVVLVRGVLKINIHEARNLPLYDPITTTTFRRLAGQDKFADYYGVYTKIFIGDPMLAKTEKLRLGDQLNPQWEEYFRADVAHEINAISFVVMADIPDNSGIKKSCVLGELRLDVADIIKKPQDPQSWTILSHSGNLPFKLDPDWYPLTDMAGDFAGSFLKLTLDFENAEKSSSGSPHLEDSYFSMRPNCNVVLYQDATTPKSHVFNDIAMSDGVQYSPRNAWNDIYEAICNATDFIYIIGWTLWVDCQLIRGGGQRHMRLGELLKKKAGEGVKVFGLLWDEKASVKVTPGLMGTHNDDTAEYFKGSEVNIILVPRKKDRLNQEEGQIFQTCYTHHQKCIIVDAEHPDDCGKRTLLGFIGGMDLARGRFDNSEHSLFSTIMSDHKDDFYQNCASVAPTMGPRQPWHDNYCRIQGEIVIDAISNFEERWRRQAPEGLQSKLLNIQRDHRYDRTFIGEVEEGSEWNCQLLRSINTDSVLFDGRKLNTLTKKAKVVTEDSIYRTYVHQIRRAQKFIYIESQFFVGSSYAWKLADKPKRNHIIPFEITNKIIEKINFDENFHVYIVIPMYPEGDPVSCAIQEVIYWQAQTIRMMYNRIAKAIQQKGIRASPTDYLSFFCLGKRESYVPDDLTKPAPKTKEAKLRKTRRFMVYVNSNVMVVDDSYIIIGSANINQRSMGGARDTELAMGAYQPEYVAMDNEPLPKGGVYAYRCALWAEHLNMDDVPVLGEPSSPHCVQRVNEAAEKNWKLYASDELQDTSGHLLKYPMQIDPVDGSVSTLEGFARFPDTKGCVLGTRSPVLSGKLTT